MSMMVPMRRNRNFLSDLMTDPFDALFDAATAPVQKMTPTLMRTDIKAKFEDGTLKIDVPKKQEQPKLEEKKTISIEG